MKVYELMSLLATMPKDAHVLLGRDENTMTFLQADQVSHVLALGGVDAVLLGAHVERTAAARTLA